MRLLPGSEAGLGRRQLRKFAGEVPRQGAQLYKGLLAPVQSAGPALVRASGPGPDRYPRLSHPASSRFPFRSVLPSVIHNCPDLPWNRVFPGQERLRGFAWARMHMANPQAGKVLVRGQSSALGRPSNPRPSARRSSRGAARTRKRPRVSPGAFDLAAVTRLLRAAGS